ncbi:ROK family protein [Actinacidiphila sp. DG2A-62]|nr:ROK family protein [Actinacidiphila sp. DG2A-62]MEC3992560.1 ROK family protein [Actinacidiphila sp. DG2A-62]
MPVLDVGGTHVTAALVDPADGLPVPASVTRRELGSHAGADGILDAIAEAAAGLPAGHLPRWGVAMPGPFDYAAGIGRFSGVGKFESLSGVDVGAGLLRRLAGRAERMCFLNDADAFALGEYRAGAAAGHERVLCLTLGTGVGSSFLRGRPVHDGPDVPPEGHAHRLTVAGRPLEDTVSRRAMRAHYARLAAAAGSREDDLAGERARGGGADGADDLADDRAGERAAPDVREIAARAARGDAVAAEVFRYAFDALGRALAPWAGRFGAGAVVVGGSMARSWDLVAPALAGGLAAAGGPAAAVLPARRPDHAPLIGAAQWVRDAPGAA